METSTKSHKAMSDSEWMSRLRKFACTGAWPAAEGNRPAPRQKKWYDLYHRIEKCPMQRPGQMSLFAHVRQCLCGFHVQKQQLSGATDATATVQRPAGQQTTVAGPVPSSSGSQTTVAGPVPSCSGSQTAAARPVPSSSGSQTAAARPVPSSSGSQIAGLARDHQQPRLNLSMFVKPRFGGSHVAAAKPNLSRARKVSQTKVTDPSESGESPVASTVLPTPDTPTALVPVLSPTAACATVSTADPGTPETTAPQLPRLWSEGLPAEDHKWITKILLKPGPKGKLVLQDNLKLWYHPPEPSPLFHQAPAPDRFFAHSLLVWMPYKLWKVKVACPNPACAGHQLTGAGLHKRARRVLDVDRIYNMVTETLTCTKCRCNHVSWSQTVLQQLDLAHRSEFRVILTQKFACDIRVIRLLRERGLGNSPTRVLKQLRENHTEEWLHRVARYTTECINFLQRPGLAPVNFPEPPEPAVVPSCKWLLSVYSQDILTRLEEIKARITSIYGTVLKMDSTKKITKKLAGTAKGTALWLTSVGNEYGQILMSVLTAQEGSGLDMMAADLVRRYQQAGVDPPVALYVDCGCCAVGDETKLKARFSGWPHLTVRLDIWHFMRRIALGCTTDAHQLYPIFMSRLSTCIFEWDAADVALLREAKKKQLQSQGMSPTDTEIDRHLSREELALHCRRRTRGEETTMQLLEELLQRLMGPSGNDSLGVPLFDRERMEHIWSVQSKHVKCIQDLPGVALYTVTGELSKGGVRLPTYRCARGSTSLESFHLHLNRFIPGTSANSLNFQVYLLEGLHRWNQDRGQAALASGPSSLRSYSGDLLHCVNSHYEKLFGRKVVPEFTPPSRYTGELIGVQYLFRQTGQALQDMHPDSEETAQLVEEQDVEEDNMEDEGFADIMDDPIMQNLEVVHISAPLSPSTSSTQTMAPPAKMPVVPTASSTVAPSRSALTSGPEATAVDHQNIPGYQHVDQLGEYLVELRDQTALCLTNQQADTIISLWANLDDWDKQRVVYAARHQDRLLSGRFRTPKRPSNTPGVESTTRCMIGASSAPAQWPDCCRLVENIITRLCNIYPSPVRRGKRADSRWSLIIRDYRKIRQLVLGNAAVMQGTEMQLVEVNQNTLIQWHNKKLKNQELSVLLQGSALPTSLIPQSAKPLQQARTLPSAPTPARQELQHQYHLPLSTAGQAQQRKTSSSGQPPHPIMPKVMVVVRPPAPEPALAPQVPPQATQLVQVDTPFACKDRKRPYRRTVASNTCKKCGQFRTAGTGHSQFRGVVYCPLSESVSKEQWLEEMRRKAAN